MCEETTQAGKEPSKMIIENSAWIHITPELFLFSIARVENFTIQEASVKELRSHASVMGKK